MKKLFYWLIFIITSLFMFSCRQTEAESNSDNHEDLIIYSVSSSIPERDIPDMLDSSDIVISGTVEKLLEARWSNPNGEKGPYARNILQTDVIIKVEQIYKNNDHEKIEVGSCVIVRINKGELDNVIFKNNEIGEYNTGDELLLLLSRDDSDLYMKSEDYYVVTGYSLGRFELSPQQSVHDTNSIYTNDVKNIYTNNMGAELTPSYLISYFSQTTDTGVHDDIDIRESDDESVNENPDAGSIEETFNWQLKIIF